MIVVKIELWPLGRESEAREIGRMTITNRGNHDDPQKRGNYIVQVMRRGTKNTLQRMAEIKDYPRESYPVWELVRRSLNKVYEKK